MLDKSVLMETEAPRTEMLYLGCPKISILNISQPHNQSSNSHKVSSLPEVDKMAENT